MSNVFGPKKPLFGPYTYRVKQNVNSDTLIAVYHGSKRVAHIDAFWAYSMRTIEEHEADEKQRGRGKRRVCATDLRALGAEGRYPNVLAVGHAFMDDDAYKGKGIGRAMYEAMMVEGFAVRETRISGQPGPMFLVPDECGGAGNTSAEAQRVWASLARDYPSRGTSIRVDAPPVIGSRARANPRRRNPEGVRFYYHGSTGEKTAGSAEGVLKDGFLRGRAVQQRSKLAPLVGRVYLTPSMEYAQIYALGGILAGRNISPSSIERYGRYGYMFVVPEAELNDPWPDEDAVGQLVSDGLRNESTYRKSLGECPRWLVRLAENSLTPKQLSRMRSLYAEYADEAAIGKKLVKVMTPEQRAELVSRGWAVASVGPTRFTQAWRIDKTRSAELREDGSNFFDIAERLPLQNPRRRNPDALGNIVFTGPHAVGSGRKDEIRFYAEVPNPRYDPEEYYVIRGEKRWWEKPLRPVGHISVERDNDGVFSVGTVAVNAEYQRKGIAKKLYDMAWDYARAHGSGLRSGWVQSPHAAAYWESMVGAGKAEPYTDEWTEHNVTKKGWRRTRNPSRSRR